MYNNEGQAPWKCPRIMQGHMALRKLQRILWQAQESLQLAKATSIDPSRSLDLVGCDSASSLCGRERLCYASVIVHPGCKLMMVHTSVVFRPSAPKSPALPVVELARQFGTPTVRLRRRQDRRADRRPAGVRRRSATPRRPARTWRFSTWCGGTACWSTPSAPAKSAGRWPPATRRTATRRRSSTRPTSSTARRSTWSSSTGIHVNCGSPDMIDQLGAAGARPRDHAADQSRLRPRPQPEDEHRRRAIEARHLARRSWPSACGGPTITAWASPACTCTSARAPTWSISRRCAARWKRRRARSAARSRRSAPAAACRCRIAQSEAYVDLDAYFELWDATRKRLEDAFGHQLRLEIEPGRYLVAESGYLVTEIRAVKQMGGNTFYLLDAGFNNLARPILYGAYHPMSIVPRDGRRRTTARCTTSSSAGRCASRAISSRRRKAASSARAQLPAAEVGDYLVIEVRRGLRLRDGLELQLASRWRPKCSSRRQAAPGPPPADVRRLDPRRSRFRRE